MNVHLENLIQWDTIIGYQFENLILNNLQTIISRLNIAPESIISCAPYYQKKTKRHEACQIDLLIHTRNTVYLCVIKFRRNIDTGILAEVQEKIKRLYLKTFSRNVLCENE